MFARQILNDPSLLMMTRKRIQLLMWHVLQKKLDAFVAVTNVMTEALHSDLSMIL